MTVKNYADIFCKKGNEGPADMPDLQIQNKVLDHNELREQPDFPEEKVTL